MSDAKLLRGVSILCWVIGGAAIAGAVAMAIHGNVGGTIGLVVFGAGWTGFGFLARFIGRNTGWASAPEGARTAATAPREEPPERDWWLERADWAEGKIRQDTTTGSRGWMIGATVMTVLGVAGALACQLGGWEPGIFGFVLAIVGAVMLIVGVRARIRARKFGLSVVECRTMPARLGERFQAVVQTGVPLQGQPQRSFQVRLTCEQRWKSGSGKNERTNHKTLWKHEETVPGTISSGGPTFQVALDLEIPEALPGSSPPGWEDRTYWTLSVRTATAGVDYAAEFEVPVARGIRGVAAG